MERFVQVTRGLMSRSTSRGHHRFSSTRVYYQKLFPHCRVSGIRVCCILGPGRSDCIAGHGLIAHFVLVVIKYNVILGGSRHFPRNLPCSLSIGGFCRSLPAFVSGWPLWTPRMQATACSHNALSLFLFHLSSSFEYRDPSVLCAGCRVLLRGDGFDLPIGPPDALSPRGSLLHHGR